MTKRSIDKYHKVKELVANGYNLYEARKKMKLSSSTYYKVAHNQDNGEAAIVVHAPDMVKKTYKTKYNTTKSSREGFVIVTTSTNLKSVLEALR